MSWLAWERLEIPLEELDEVAGETEVCASLLRLLPPRPDPRWIDGWITQKRPEQKHCFVQTGCLQRPTSSLTVFGCVRSVEEGDPRSFYI